MKGPRYLCGNCGYREERIASREDIRKLKAKYNKSGANSRRCLQRTRASFAASRR